MNKTISERIMDDHIIYYLETVILHVVFNVHVCANGSHGEHIESKIMWNTLKSWVILQKKISPLEYVSDCGVLIQEQCLVQVKIKITIEFEDWLRCYDELHSESRPIILRAFPSQIKKTSNLNLDWY